VCVCVFLVSALASVWLSTLLCQSAHCGTVFSLFVSVCLSVCLSSVFFPRSLTFTHSLTHSFTHCVLCQPVRTTLWLLCSTSPVLHGYALLSLSFSVSRSPLSFLSSHYIDIFGYLHPYVCAIVRECVERYINMKIYRYMCLCVCVFVPVCVRVCVFV